MRGDDKVIPTPADWQYNDRLPVRDAGHYRNFETQIRDTEPVQFTVASRQAARSRSLSPAPATTSTGPTALVGAVAALGIAGIAYGAVRSTRGMGRPATT